MLVDICWVSFFQTFGIFEGKKFQDLFEAAAEYNLDWPDFIPEGAETSEEVLHKFVSK